MKKYLPEEIEIIEYWHTDKETGIVYSNLRKDCGGLLCVGKEAVKELMLKAGVIHGYSGFNVKVPLPELVPAECEYTWMDADEFMNTNLDFHVSAEIVLSYLNYGI